MTYLLLCITCYITYFIYRAIYDIAIRQPELDMPEMLWKEFIDFETNEGETQHVRDLYTRLLERTSHVKVWISFGKFEAAEALGQQSIGGSESTSGNNAITDPMREVFRRGYALLKSQGLKEERLLLLQAWRECEAEAVKAGLVGDTATVDAMMPKKVEMRRMATGEGADGTTVDLGWEEYYDYVFPDDEKKIGSLKILEKALLWKQAAAALEASSSSTTTTAAATATGEEEVGESTMEVSTTTLGKRSLEESQKDDAAIDIDDI